MAGKRFMEWFRLFGWSDNPFKIRPDPGNIVGFIDMRTRILTYIKSEDPFIVTGATGAGKTTLLKWLEENKEDSVYFNFLNEIDEKEFKKAIEGTFWEKLLSLFSDRRKLVLIDEAQEMPPKLLKWLRGRFDEGEISSVVLASIKEDLNNLEEPFADRIGRRIVFVRKLTEEEAFKMVKQRMFSKGDVNPFTEEGLRRVFEISHFSPRKILENCESCCIYAVGEGAKYINRSLVNKALEDVEHEEIKAEQKKTNYKKEPQGYGGDLKSLSPGQQKIINMLEGREMTTKQIAEEIGASRASVAKQLSRLSFKTDQKLLK
ncbi:MAG: AAA family ATPase, partial [archaeon]